MGANQSWTCEGRQYHGWFGNGTCASQEAEDGRPDLGDLGRIHAVAYGAAASLPPVLRTRFSRQLDTKTLARLTRLMTAWARSSQPNSASFAARFFGRDTDDRIAEKLRSAARGADLAKSHADLRDAAVDLASAIQAIGLDRWPRFLDDAERHAGDPATLAAIEKSEPTPNSEKSAGKPSAEAPAPSGAHPKSVSRTSPFTANGAPPDLTPTPLLDDQGKPVLTIEGRTMMRPAGVDPHFFIRQAEELRKQLEPGVANEMTAGAVMGEIAAELLLFRQGRAWDLQRLDGHNHPEFRDIASVVIGLYGAAAGIPPNLSLELQDQYARWFSIFGNSERDPVYTHLAKRNVFNTRLGYELYRSHRVALDADK